MLGCTNLLFFFSLAICAARQSQEQLCQLDNLPAEQTVMAILVPLMRQALLLLQMNCRSYAVAANKRIDFAAIK